MISNDRTLALVFLFLVSACNTKSTLHQGSTEPKARAARDKKHNRDFVGSGKTAGHQEKNRPDGRPESSQASQAPGKPVTVEIYVMSMCPYAARALQNLIPAVKQIGNRVNLQIDYIVSGRPGQFSSLHGPAEVLGDKIQLCAREIAPDRFLDFLSCQSENPRTVSNSWMQCAKRTGIDGTALKACAFGPDGDKLLAKSAAKSRARNVRGSPTIYVANRRYSGNRSQEDFMRVVCQAMSGSRPAVCVTVKKPVTLQVTLLTDQRCKQPICLRANRLLRSMRRLFPGAKIRTLDYSSPDGKQLFGEAKLRFLPALLFDQRVEQTKAYPRLRPWMTQAGPYRSLRLGAKFDPTAEICDNGKDDTGNGKVDCADSTCKTKLVCRTQKPKRLDLFVMSRCPFGIKALNSMKEVLTNFKGEIDFHIHYIGTKRANGSLSSMHGPKEVEEDKRALCAMKHYPKNYQYMDYIWCRNKNPRSDDWKRCATGRIRASRIARCVKRGEGTRLLTESFKTAEDLGIDASPTWLVNNRFMFSGLDAETVRKNLCQHNPTMKNCGKQLNSKITGPAASCK